MTKTQHTELNTIENVENLSECFALRNAYSAQVSFSICFVFLTSYVLVSELLFIWSLFAIDSPTQQPYIK